MEHLWAPWRLQFILGSHDPGCIFCTRPGAGHSHDAENLILDRRDHCFTLMNLYPYNNGHLLIAPYRHLASLGELSPIELMDLMLCAQEWETVLTRAMNPQGFNLGFNLGKVAGAGYDQHLHLHVVPRWQGDTNFMPALAQTRVLSDSLEHSYVVLRDHLMAYRQEQKEVSRKEPPAAGAVLQPLGSPDETG